MKEIFEKLMDKYKNNTEYDLKFVGYEINNNEIRYGGEPIKVPTVYLYLKKEKDNPSHYYGDFKFEEVDKWINAVFHPVNTFAKDKDKDDESIFVDKEEENDKKNNNDFLQNYDGCLSSNGDMENVCGSSSITLTNGERKTIYFKATNSSNFLCYYNIKKSDNNDNRIQYSITINGNSPPKFKLFLLLYFSDKQTKMQYISQSSISSDLYDEEDEIGFQKISIYLDVEDPQNLEELSITVSNIVESSTTTPTTISTTSNSLPPTYSPSPGNLTQPTYSPSPGNLTQPTDSPSPGDSSSGNYNLKSSGSNKGLIVGVVIGAIVLILGIILAVFSFLLLLFSLFY